tara:strand:+ start:130 stop:258 length:129 start_codon:yes stop_codon:yes gene_type:complete
MSLLLAVVAEEPHNLEEALEVLEVIFHKVMMVELQLHKELTM